MIPEKTTNFDTGETTTDWLACGENDKEREEAIEPSIVEKALAYGCATDYHELMKLCHATKGDRGNASPSQFFKMWVIENENILKYLEAGNARRDVIEAVFLKRYGKSWEHRIPYPNKPIMKNDD